MSNRQASHTVSRLTCHLVQVTNYRYQVLQGDIQERCRDLLIQACELEDVIILKGVLSLDHVHMHIENPLKVGIRNLVKKLKGRSSRRIQSEFPKLKVGYWGKHFWVSGYGAWSTENITNEMVNDYL